MSYLSKEQLKWLETHHAADECAACQHRRDAHSSWWLGPIAADGPEPEYCEWNDASGDCPCKGFMEIE